MHHRRAFTLIELLVVVGIIGMLTTMLLPSLVGAMEAARRVACLNNIRAVVIANTTYAGDNNEHYALAAEGMTGGNLKRWFGERENTNAPFELAGPLADYLPSNLVKPCPSFQTFVGGAGQDAAFEAGCGGYGYNELYIGGRFDLRKGPRGYSKSATTGGIDVASQTVMFADTAYKSRFDGLIAYSFTHAPKWIPSFFGGGANPPIHFRHAEKANIGWADTHATSEPMTYSSDYTTHGPMAAEDVAELGLGWFGKQYDSLPDANYLFDLD